MTTADLDMADKHGLTLAEQSHAWRASLSNMSEADIDVQNGVLIEACTMGYGSPEDVPVHESRRCAESTRADAERWAVAACKYMMFHDGYTEFRISIERDDDAVNPFTATVDAIKYIDIHDGSDE